MLKVIFQGILVVIGLLILVPLLGLLWSLLSEIFSSINFASISGEVWLIIGCGLVTLVSLIIIIKN